MTGGRLRGSAAPAGPRGAALPRRDPHLRAGLAAAGLACAVAFVVLYRVAVCTVSGQRTDATLFGELQDIPLGGLASVPRDGVPVVLAFAVAVGGVAAVVRRRWSSLVVASIVVAGTVVLSLVLRRTLSRPFLGDFAYDHNTFPSNHVALTASLAVACVVLAPAARWVAPVAGAAGALLALACLYNVVGFAHRPSDVLGGLLIAAGVSAFVLACSGLGRRSRPAPRAQAADGAPPVPGSTA